MVKNKIQPWNKKIDNSFILIKIAIRQWVLQYFNRPHILDIYGGYGEMYNKVWKENALIYNVATGDAIKYLQQQKELNQDVFDVDPYGSPYKAIYEIIQKVTKIK